MEKELTPTCRSCRLFDKKGFCTLHKIEVCYNDEACREHLEKDARAAEDWKGNKINQVAQECP